MNLLHRYLFRELLFATAFGVALFGFILLTGNAVKDVIGPLLDGVITLGTATELLVVNMPALLPYALPMGMLTAVLLVLGRLSAQHEITAMRAAGVGVVRIAAPALALAVLGTAASLVINFSYAPDSKSRYRELLHEIGQKNPVAVIQPGRFVRDFKDALIYVQQRHGDVLSDVWVWTFDDESRVTQFFRAEEATLRWNEAHDALLLVAENATIEARRQPDPEDFSRVPPLSFARVLTMPLPLDKAFRRQAFVEKVSWMNLTELMAEQRRLRGSDEPADEQRLVEVKMSIHEKATFAFAVLSFTFIGVPLGIRTGRKETSANLGIALLLTMAFYILVIAASWMEDRPALHPELLLWTPNIVFQALGGWMWWRLGRN